MVSAYKLKSELRLEDVLEHYGIELKNNKACCPFHNEDTPSFFVNKKKQYFHCFGCGVGGDMITFVRLYFNCGFTTAVQTLCTDFNITSDELPSEIIREQENKRKRLAFKKWVDDTYIILIEAIRASRYYLEFEKPVFSLDEVSDDYVYIMNHIDKLEWFSDVLSDTDGIDFYKNYGKEVYTICKKILKLTLSVRK